MKSVSVQSVWFIHRWLRFNAVGALGICIQLITVFLCGSILGFDALRSTALGVEAAVLHNFVWHEHFTWADRRVGSRREVLRRLFAFNMTVGAVSIAGNMFLVSLFMRELCASLLFANLISIATCSLLNFVVNDKIVFRERKSPSSLTSQ